jgi:hypothetical protein
MNPSGKMRYYPGSPYIAEQVAREQDRLRLFELHPADSKLLADNFRKLEEHAAAQGIRSTVRGKRVITRGDGFASLKALLPPPSRRALVLIDPPYEDKQDYKKTKDAGRSAGPLPDRHLRGLVSAAAAHGIAPVRRQAQAAAGCDLAQRGADHQEADAGRDRRPAQQRHVHPEPAVHAGADAETGHAVAGESAGPGRRRALYAGKRHPDDGYAQQ